METPDNHFTRRADDRYSIGHPGGTEPAWPAVIAAILAWGVIVILFTLLALPFVQWVLDGKVVHP